MPRYHFNVHDGVSLPDEDGADLPDLASARIEAVKLAGAMLRDHAGPFWNGEEWKLDVTDDKGLLLFTLMFIAIDAPSTAKY